MTIVQKESCVKAVIVFDVDSDFDFDQKLWVQIEEYLDGEILESGCHAVKPLPQKMTWGHTADYIEGYNACLEEITERPN